MDLFLSQSRSIVFSKNYLDHKLDITIRLDPMLLRRIKEQFMLLPSLKIFCKELKIKKILRKYSCFYSKTVDLVG